MKKRWNKIIACLTAAALVIGYTSTLETNRTNAAVANGDNGTYHAALGLQTFDKDGKCLHRYGYYYYDKKDSLQRYDSYGTDNFNKLLCDDWKTDASHIYDATCTDAVLAGDGTYTISVSGNFQGDKVLSQLHISTDVPKKNTTLKFTNVSASVNNVPVPGLTFDEAYRETDSNNEKGGQVYLLLNHWRSKKGELVDILKDKGLPESGDRDTKDGWTLLNGSGVETISITFTVTGFSYDLGQTPPAAPEPTASAAPSSAPGTTGGDQTATPVENAENAVAMNGIIYQAKESSAKVLKVQEEKNSYKIADTITINDNEYKVTEIGSSAFANQTKLKKITIGKNITSIKSNAFSGCKNLKTIDLKKNTCLKSVAGNAFKNVNKKCVAKVPASKKKAYRKKLKKIKVK